MRPAAHLDGHAGLDASDFVFRHRKHHIARTICGNPHHGCASCHDLARLGLNGGDHTRHIRHQGRITGLVALHCQLRLSLLVLGLRRFEYGFAALQLSAADEVLLFQFFVALVVASSQIAVGGGCLQLRPGGLCGQFVVLRVQLGQHLPSLDALAQFGLTLDDFPAHPEAQTGFNLGFDLARKLITR